MKHCGKCGTDVSTTIGFARNHDGSVVWCPYCGERLELVARQEDSAKWIEIAIVNDERRKEG